MRHTAIFSATISAFLLCTGQLMAEEMQRSISVTGEGKAVAKPDMATIHTGVVSQAATAKEALAANSKAMEAVLAELKKRGIAAEDVQTSQFSVQPTYKQDERRRTAPEIAGYQVTNQVRVRVRKLDRIGEVLDGLVEAGSNQLSGITFGLNEPRSVLDTARIEAIGDARRRAELYAKAAGVRVGKVQRINEQNVRFPQPVAMARNYAMAAEAVPVAAGEEEFHVTIDVTFTLEDGE
jgi:uncharacterized protein YggE